MLIVCNIFYSPLSLLLLEPREMKPAVTESASIMSCSPNGLDIIEYTKYTVQNSNIPIAKPRKIFRLLNI